MEVENQQKRKKNKGNACTSLLKTFYIIIQVVFLLLGLAVAAFGIYRIANQSNQSGLLFITKELSIGLLAIGIVLIVVSILGIIAASTGNSFVSFLYMFFLIALIAAQILFIVFNTKAVTNAKTKLSTYWDTLNDASKTELQTKGKCCGFESSTDRQVMPCPEGATDGCYVQVDRIFSKLLHNAILVFGVVFGVEGVLLALTLLFCCLRRK